MISIIFDTNVLRRILENENDYKDIMKKLQNSYEFKISSFTFVEIVRQIIEDKSTIERLMNLLISYKINCKEFRNYKIIEDPNFTYKKFKLMECNKRENYFNIINNKNNEFICLFLALFLECILYALVILLDNNYNSNKNELDYLKYLNKNFENFKNKFLNVYCNSNKVRIKNQFSILMYEELEKIYNGRLDINKEKLYTKLEQFKNNKKDLTQIFTVYNKEYNNLRKTFFDIYYENGIHDFFKNYTLIFQEYIKCLFEKIIVKCGKVDENDIVDCLILNSIDENEKDILLTNDEDVQNFLKRKEMWYEDIFRHFFP